MVLAKGLSELFPRDAQGSSWASQYPSHQARTTLVS
jgi:hypothetical protein